MSFMSAIRENDQNTLQKSLLLFFIKLALVKIQRVFRVANLKKKKTFWTLFYFTSYICEK